MWNPSQIQAATGSPARRTASIPATWLYRLSEEAPHGTELYISLDIPRLYGWGNDSYQTLDCLTQRRLLW